MLGAERKACLGMRQLEEAVLDVLFEAKRNGECLSVPEISRRAGIYSGKGDTSKGEPGSMTLGDRPEIVSGRSHSKMPVIAGTQRI